MFKKVFEYAGPHKKDLYIATFIVLLSVLMGVLPFVLAYQVISPLVMGNAVDTKYVCIRVIGVLICLILQAILYGWDWMYPIRPLIARCSGFALPCKRDLKQFHLDLSRIREPAQLKSCLWMMWTVWKYCLPTLCRRGLQT